jgi:branched-chain amino acid transport system ATP-binding protein
VALLEVDDLSVRFGGVRALSNVTFAVESGEFVSVIGPNGAGKTTLFNVIAGRFRPTSGDVRVKGHSVRRLGQMRMNRLGVGRTFQVARPFRSLTVADNVRLAAASHRYGRSPRMLRLRRFDRAVRERADALLELVDLVDVAGRPASDLNMGSLRRLEAARALASEPEILLLDEPAAGIGADGIRPLARLIEKIGAGGTTVLLVEHHVGFALALCDRVVVLDEGRKIAEGAPDEIRSDERVIEAYLGEAPPAPVAEQ